MIYIITGAPKWSEANWLTILQAHLSRWRRRGANNKDESLCSCFKEIYYTINNVVCSHLPEQTDTLPAAGLQQDSRQSPNSATDDAGWQWYKLASPSWTQLHPRWSLKRKRGIIAEVLMCTISDSICHPFPLHFVRDLRGTKSSSVSPSKPLY